MTQEDLSGSWKTYDVFKQVLMENQIIVHYGDDAEVTRFVVCQVELQGGRYLYHLINLKTKAFAQTNIVCPLQERNGIGMYYNAGTLELMDTCEVAILRGEAARIAQEQGLRTGSDRQVNSSPQSRFKRFCCRTLFRKGINKIY